MVGILKERRNQCQRRVNGFEPDTVPADGAEVVPASSGCPTAGNDKTDAALTSDIFGSVRIRTRNDSLVLGARHGEVAVSCTRDFSYRNHPAPIPGSAHVPAPKIEARFRTSKHDPRIRPIFCRKERRIPSHIAICAMAFRCLQHLCRRLAIWGHRMSPDRIL